MPLSVRNRDSTGSTLSANAAICKVGDISAYYQQMPQSLWLSRYEKRRSVCRIRGIGVAAEYSALYAAVRMTNFKLSTPPALTTCHIGLSSASEAGVLMARPAH